MRAMPINPSNSSVQTADSSVSELIETIRQLKAREKQLLGLLGSAANSVMGMDTEGIVTEWNPGAERILGWSKPEAMGRRMSELIIPEQLREAHESGMRRYVETGQAHVLNRIVPMEARHKDGHIFPIELIIWQVSTDRCDGFAASIRDVSILHDSQRVLRESEERYRSVVEHLGEGMFVAQNDRVVFCNAQASTILRVPNEQLLGSDPTEWIHPDDRTIVLNLRSRLQQGLDTEPQYELRHIGQDGTIVWLNIRPKPVAWGSGQATLTFFSDVTAQKQILQAMERSEERYRAVIENVDSGMVVNQADRFVYANRRAGEIARMTQEDILQVGFLHRIHPQDHALILDRRARRLAGEDVPSRYEVRLLHDDGSVCWIELGVSVVPWDGLPATITFFSDVTQRRAMTEALQRSEDRYRAVVEHSGEGMVVVHDGRFVFVNRRAAELVQMTPEDMIREGYLHRIHPDDKQLVDDRRKRRLAGETVPSRYEIRMLLPGEIVRWLDIGVTVVPWDGATASLTFFSDITDRKNAQAELQRTASEREAIFNSALVGIVLSVRRELRWVNDKLAEMVGLSKEELIGQTTRVFFASEEEWKDAVALQRASLLETGVFSGVRQLQLASGASLWVQVAGRCIRDREPDAGVIWTFLDISERVRAEQNTLAALEKERELNELRSRFVAMTSHEFRTPLATILSSAELLKYYGERIPAEEKMEVIETIESSVHRMTRMLDRVLLLGKADAQMLEFNPREIDLHALCCELVEEVKTQYPDSKHTIVCTFDAHTRIGKFDEKLLRHVFGNLLSNALKYSPDGGEVSFSIERESGRVVFRVRDHGIGIPPEEVPHLFESFHRASNVGDIQGTGLGLAIVRNSVHLHGGEIQVSSNMGAGTTFAVTL
jgi:PAS domain S-box-containing protein